MYFSNFPQTLFLVSPPGHAKPAEYVSVVDITKNVRFKKDVLDNISVYDWYLIKEGDTLEITSEKLYGSPYYHWILMLLNGMYDYRNDFPLEPAQFDAHMIEKYGSIETARSTISFYRNEDGWVVDADTPGAQAVYAYDHEIAINDSKRRIKIISPEMLQVTLDHFRSLM